MKRKDSNCVGILSDQKKAEASNLSEYTVTHSYTVQYEFSGLM